MAREILQQPFLGGKKTKDVVQRDDFARRRYILNLNILGAYSCHLIGPKGTMTTSGRKLRGGYHVSCLGFSRYHTHGIILTVMLNHYSPTVTVVTVIGVIVKCPKIFKNARVHAFQATWWSSVLWCTRGTISLRNDYKTMEGFHVCHFLALYLQLGITMTRI